MGAFLPLSYLSLDNKGCPPIYLRSTFTRHKPMNGVSINSIFKKLVVWACSEIQVFVQLYSVWLPWLMKLTIFNVIIRSKSWELSDEKVSLEQPPHNSTQNFSPKESSYGCFFNSFQLETSMNQAGIKDCNWLWSIHCKLDVQWIAQFYHWSKLLLACVGVRKGSHCP